MSNMRMAVIHFQPETDADALLASVKPRLLEMIAAVL
jgi:hypothetical protein